MKTYKKKKAGVKKQYTKKKMSVNSSVNKIIKKSKKSKKSPPPIQIESEDQFLEHLIQECPNFRNLGKNYVKQIFIDQKFEFAHARTIMNSFTTLLRNEGINPKEKNKFNQLSSDYKHDCLLNFKKNVQNSNNLPPRCFCCGEKIEYDVNLNPIDVACDHVIPIITMLFTIKPNSISKNLHFIHTKCNGKKINKSIYDTYINLGKTDGIFKDKCKTKDNSKDCKKRFLNILKNLNLRSVEDINYRLSTLNNFKKFMNDYKDYITFFLDDEKSGAIALLKLAHTKQKITSPEYTSSENSSNRSRSKSRSRSRSSSRSSSRSETSSIS